MYTQMRIVGLVFCEFLTTFPELSHHRLEAGGFDRRLKARLVFNTKTTPDSRAPGSRASNTGFPVGAGCHSLPTYWKWSPEGEGF